MGSWDGGHRAAHSAASEPPLTPRPARHTPCTPRLPPTTPSKTPRPPPVPPPPPPVDVRRLPGARLDLWRVAARRRLCQRRPDLLPGKAQVWRARVGVRAGAALLLRGGPAGVMGVRAGPQGQAPGWAPGLGHRAGRGRPAQLALPARPDRTCPSNPCLPPLSSRPRTTGGGGAPSCAAPPRVRTGQKGRCGVAQRGTAGGAGGRAWPSCRGNPTLRTPPMRPPCKDSTSMPTPPTFSGPSRTWGA